MNIDERLNNLPDYQKMRVFVITCVLLGFAVGWWMGISNEQFVVAQNIEHSTKPYITIGDNIYTMTKINMTPEQFVIQQKYNEYNKTIDDKPELTDYSWICGSGNFPPKENECVAVPNGTNQQIIDAVETTLRGLKPNKR